MDTVTNSLDDPRTLYTAIGFMVVQWAQLEQALDSCIAVIYHEHQGKPLMKGHGVPVSLSTKTKFLKVAFNRLTTLAPLRDQGRALLEGIKDAKDLRHSMIHAALNNLQANGGVFSFTKLEYVGDFHRITPFDLDLKRFPDHARTFEALAEQAVALAESLLVRSPKPPRAP